MRLRLFVVDGRWSLWKPWGPCSLTCAGGVQRRIRTCSNPPPKYGGKNCEGNALQTQSCNRAPCPGTIFPLDSAVLDFLIFIQFSIEQRCDGFKLFSFKWAVILVVMEAIFAVAFGSLKNSFDSTLAVQCIIDFIYHFIITF